MAERHVRYANRREAGRRLANELVGVGEATVLGLPRGGVPVAYEVAAGMNLALDVIVVRKLGVPGRPEVAMGAIGEGGAEVVDEPFRRLAHVTDSEFEAVLAKEHAAMARRVRRYRQTVPRLDLTGREAVVVDDGMATGSTARAACQVARTLGAVRIVLAVPVASVDALAALRPAVDELVCPLCPEEFGAVGQWYEDFRPTTDDEVLALLARSRAHRDGGGA
ncbi:phosphoribosyltransferase [Kutzneria buriramensis]|uniref:Putative phosphoribosyl transferase n=1 Tax=Kutzneria buriramensis TaxID=1045776 RepID=A0A3E0GZQ7_9PSEU|nr:phosphoribosyltransferase family protein [Kutzneria buriramensis]REH34853.1 putative phosphoribosyl transferase [Kutzneria buriramensis]